MRRFRAVLILEALAVIALVVALLRRNSYFVGGAFTYEPTSKTDPKPVRLDALGNLGVLDARLWLGIAIGLAVAGLVVGLLVRPQHEAGT